MRCPFCSEDNDKVIDSRSSREGAAIRRRRQCQTCDRRFTTYEYVEESQVIVIKKDRRREEFDRKKLISGIQLACKKRPVSTEEVDSIAERVQHKIEVTHKGEIESIKIGEILMDELYSVDQIAYIRFASVYRDFKSADEFVNQVSKLSK
jgi:transcriptional repressor NrdR